MEDTSFLAPLLLTIGGLVIGALLKSLLRHTRIPYTVGLFAVGLLVGLLNRYGIFNFWSDLSEGVNSVANINPDLILYLFLPILIFDAAYDIELEYGVPISVNIKNEKHFKNWVNSLPYYSNIQKEGIIIA